MGIQKSMDKIDAERVERFVKEVVRIERRFSAEQKNQRSNRLGEIRDFLERFAAKEMEENEDK